MKDNIFLLYCAAESYIIGVYTSEMLLIESVFRDLRECEESLDDGWEFSKVNDFLAFSITLDKTLNIIISLPHNQENSYIENGKQIKYGTYNDMRLKLRELKLNQLV